MTSLFKNTFWAFLLFSFTFTDLAFSSGGSSNENLVKEFGPKVLRAKVYRRYNVHRFSFSPEDENSEYVIRVINGDGKAPKLKNCRGLTRHRRIRCYVINRLKLKKERLLNASQVYIHLNGKRIFADRRFQKVKTFKDIRTQLKAKNNFQIYVRGSKIARIKLAIYRVDQPNLPPVAAFESSVQDLSVSLDASNSSDPDGNIASFSWNLGDGNSASGSSVQHTYATAGTYDIQLTVTDNDGATNSVTQSVTVEAGNALPVGDFFYGHNNQALPMVMQFKAINVSDADGQVVNFDWNFGDGNTASGEEAVNLYFSPGTFTVTLTLTDDQGGQTVISKEIIASDNQLPIANFDFNPPGSKAPATISFDGSSSSDPDGHNIIDYTWKVSDGREFKGQNVDIDFTDAGEYEVELTVLDELHGFSSTTKTVIITVTEAPVIVLVINNDDPTAPAVCEFDASGSSDPDGTIVSFDWEFGDGNNGSGSIVTHTYQFPGSYPAKLRVTDSDGDMAIKEFIIEVQ